MLLEFSSKAAPRFIMFAKHALPILEAAGRPYSTELPERGVIPRDQMADAVSRLEQALLLVKDEEEAELAAAEEEEEEKEKVPPMQRPVFFRQRSFPLLDMMRKARDQNADVLWEPANTDW